MKNLLARKRDGVGPSVRVAVVSLEAFLVHVWMGVNAIAVAVLVLVLHVLVVM
jgi:hypothetical protein